ncbi:UNVERIFIED_CONTAM: hypothetical protein GTU68_065657 [Idotea baltica]|nr:hypothetical protein [Idotea baltica]
MSAKRVAFQAGYWAAFATRVQQIRNRNLLPLSQMRLYVRKVASLPDALPQIHWDQYASRVAVPGMVNEFKKQYEALQISYPKDSYSPAIDSVQAKVMKEVKEFIVKSEETIAERKAELSKWEAMIPFTEMTLEEYAEAFPDQAINLDKPTMYPHTPESQPGYVHEEAPAH